ncbi:MAG: fimbrial major subunit CsuA/B family protein, partial [Oxalobacter sp.]|nr:fimbrial major subunit CsuA/B family protein [Oxalobacter sp.]
YPCLRTSVTYLSGLYTSANNGTVENVNIYGRAYGNSPIPPSGTYTDELTVQLTY